MAGRRPPERGNQRYRTRKDLLAAAALLVKDGRRPSLEEVAEAALVSRATAYRYFPNVAALLVEAAIDLAVPDGEVLFAGDPSVDPEERVDKAEAAMHRMVLENEAALRHMLAAALVRAAEGDAGDGVPLRQNRRTPLIEAALAPARGRFDDVGYAKLRAALAMICGPESMVVSRDVLRLDDRTAREVKSWAVRALVRAALEGSRPSGLAAAPESMRAKRARPGGGRDRRPTKRGNEGNSMRTIGALSLVVGLGLAAPSAGAQGADPLVARGEYLARIMDCTGCHTPGSLTGRPDMGRYLGGSDVGFMIPELGVFFPPNLTPDRETGLGAWSEADIVAAMRAGVRPDGRELAPAMPWRSYAALTDDDARALAAYLKGLPPVRHAAPPIAGPSETPQGPYFTVAAPG
jgi:mono/diheme cytochrome c family protein